MQELTPSDIHDLNAAIGWLELGVFDEAIKEYRKLAERYPSQFEVLEVGWRIMAANKNWIPALEIAEQMVESAPDLAEGWINQSYSLHELKRTQEAWNRLLPALKRFPKESIIPYNLACYAAQLDKTEDAKQFLDLAIRLKGKQQIKKMALNDTDLQPLWEFIKGL